MNLADWLRAAPFTLTMSSGFFGFFAHTGFLSVLEEAGLAPSRVSGSSAGALVGGAWAAGLSALRLRETLLALRRESFWDPRMGLGLLRGGLFRGLLDELLPVSTFAACRVPLAVSVFDLAARRTRVLEAGLLAPAIQASCAVPFLFHPVWIDGHPYVDGGVADRPGLMGVASGERVLFHHLAARSPWRRRGSHSLLVPERANLVSVVLDDLPRVGPFTLEVGRHAYEAAREGMKKTLAAVVQEAH